MPIEGESFASMPPNITTLQMYKSLSKDRYSNGSFPFRLATLLPGAGTDDVCIDLTVEVSRVSHTEPYEALSYVWGSTSKPVEVTINLIDGADNQSAGKSVSERLLVAKNLYSALHHLRYPDRARSLWVDALCINQADDDEKSEQVSRMADVYRRAQRVVVWMGPEGNHSALALKTLESMGSHIEIEWGTYVARPTTGEESVHSLVTLKSWAAIVNFLYRDWFERMWVQQEISVAHTVIIMCGHTAARWNEVKMAIFYVLSQGDMKVAEDSDNNGDVLRELNERCHMRYENLSVFWRSFTGSSSLFHFLSGFRRLRCENPRDRIFALSAMGSQSPALSRIKPDYSAPVAKIYTDVVRQHLRDSSEVKFLEFCDLDNPDLPPDLPSWVPDWTEKQFKLAHPRSVTGELRGSVQLEEENALRLTGIFNCKVSRAERVQLAGYLSHGGIGNGDMVNIGRALHRLLDGPRTAYATDGACEILARGVLRSPYLREDYAEISANQVFVYPSSDKPIQQMRSLFGEHEAVPCEGKLWIKDNHRAANRAPRPGLNPERNNKSSLLVQPAEDHFERSIFLTDDGRLGIGPASAETGDSIWGILGCSPPVMLRDKAAPDTPPQGLHVVVGSVILEGLTTGEAFLGPLSAAGNFQQVFRREDGRISIWYRDESTGRLVDVDPRFRRLTGVPEGLAADGTCPETREDWCAAVTPEVLDRSGIQIQEVLLA